MNYRKHEQQARARRRLALRARVLENIELGRYCAVCGVPRKNPERGIFTCSACRRHVACCTVCGMPLVVRRANVRLEGDDGTPAIPLDSWNLDHVEPHCETWKGRASVMCLPALPPGVTWDEFMAVPAGCA